MKHIVKTIVIAMGLMMANPVFAASPTDAFSSCMVDALSGKERKNLAKWIFLSISTHPDIKPYSNASSQDVQIINEYVGKLITKLLTTDCPKELKAAYKIDPQAIQKGFEIVGRVAMQEIMTNKDTMKALTGYVQYTNEDMIRKTLYE